MADDASSRGLTSPSVLASYHGSLLWSPARVRAEITPSSRPSTAGRLIGSPETERSPAIVRYALHSGERASQQHRSSIAEAAVTSAASYYRQPCPNSSAYASSMPIESSRSCEIGMERLLAASMEVVHSYLPPSKQGKYAVDGIPVQVLFLVVRWMKLCVDWDDVLRVTNRFPCISSRAADAAAQGPPRFLSICDFKACLGQLSGIHLSIRDAKNVTTALADTEAAFWSALAARDGNGPYSSLRGFLQEAVQQEKKNLAVPFAALFTTDVLEVYAAYGHRLRYLLQNLVRLQLHHVCGLEMYLNASRKLAALSMHRDDDIEESNIDAVKRSALLMRQLLPPRHWPQLLDSELMMSDSSTISTFSELCEILCASAVARASIAAVGSGSQPVTVRQALLDCLSSACGVLLLPEPSWQDRILRALTDTLGRLDAHRKHLAADIEANLRRLYLYASSVSDVNGTGQLTVAQFGALMREAAGVPWISYGSNTQSLSGVGSPPRTNFVPPRLFTPPPAHHLERFAANKKSDEEDATRSIRLIQERYALIEPSAVIPFHTFLQLLESIARVNSDGAAISNMLSAPFSIFVSRILATRVGREAMRCVPRDIAEMPNCEQFSKHIPAFEKVFDALRASLSSRQWMHNKKKLCGSTKKTSNVIESGDDTKALPIHFVVDTLQRTGAIPTLTSRGGASRAVRRVRMDVVFTPVPGSQQVLESSELSAENVVVTAAPPRTLHPETIASVAHGSSDHGGAGDASLLLPKHHFCTLMCLLAATTSYHKMPPSDAADLLIGLLEKAVPVTTATRLREALPSVMRPA